jgi:hypothetical protein
VCDECEKTRSTGPLPLHKPSGTRLCKKCIPALEMRVAAKGPVLGTCHECKREVKTHERKFARFTYTEYGLCCECDRKAEDDDADVDPSEAGATDCALCNKPKLTCKPPKFPSEQPNAGVCFTCRCTCTDPEHDGDDYDPSTQLVHCDPKTGKPICALCNGQREAAEKHQSKKDKKKD